MTARRTKPATRAPNRSARKTTKAKRPVAAEARKRAKFRALLKFLERYDSVGRGLAEWDRSHATGGEGGTAI